MVDVNKLAGKMTEKRISVQEMAKQLGLDRATMYRRLKGDGGNITIREANAICRVLNLSYSEVMAIFFAQYVA